MLPIRTLGDPVLREPARAVTTFDRALRALADDMIESMYAAPGVGLAGPQVGVSLRIFVFDDGETGPLVMVNPVVSDVEGEVVEDEGCLSIPGPYHVTPRAAHVVCRGVDVRGRPLEMSADGLLARIFQHESDHLDGRLYIDRLDDEGRRAVLAELRRFELGLASPRRAER
ncbi:MAG TPA: peptide deformylase [Actinomycetota bacterium]|nr:peptide deformylase [Actinomycetota bacterium]